MPDPTPMEMKMKEQLNDLRELICDVKCESYPQKEAKDMILADLRRLHADIFANLHLV